MRKGTDLKLLASCKTMLAEFRQRYNEEISRHDYEENLFFNAVNKKQKNEALKHAEEVVRYNLRIAGLDKIMDSINIISKNVATITKSKTMLDEYKSSFQIICVAADIFKIKSFMTFRTNLIKEMYGSQMIQTLMDTSTMIPDIKTFFEDKKFSTGEINDTIADIAKKKYRGDLSKVEFIIGPQENTKQQNQNPPKEPDNLKKPQSVYNMYPKFDIPQNGPPVFTPNQKTDNKPHQDFVYPKFNPSEITVTQPIQKPTSTQPPPSLFKKPVYPEIKPIEQIKYPTLSNPNIPFQPNQQTNNTNTHQGNNHPNKKSNITFTKFPNVYHLVQLPPFPKAIWPKLSKVVQSAIA